MNWDNIASQVHGVVNRLAPYVQPLVAVGETLVPEIAPAIAIGTKIIQGVAAGEEAAIELYKQITTGASPSPDDLKKFLDQYEDSYQQLDSDITEALKTAT